MKKIIILQTDWEPDYWERDQEAPYTKTKYTDLPEWDQLSTHCPLAGLGVYIKGKKNDFSAIPFVYLKINGMRYDEKSLQPFFNFNTIQKSATPSRNLTDRLPSKKLFSAIDANSLITILTEIGERPPKEWLELTELVETPLDWHDFIGKYFLELESRSLGDDEFEDRIAKLLTALGFDVAQKGHKIKGEYCDGIATFEGEYAVVYDCKNTVNFIPTAEDIRALEKYLTDEKKSRNEKYLFSAFIAKSFGVAQKDVFYFSVDALLYLLYKKLIIGSKFSLSPFRKILTNNMSVNIETIKTEWLNS